MVAAGQRDQALHPRHPRHERPGLVAGADRLERGAAQLGRGLVGSPARASASAAGQPGGRTADRGLAVERGAEQVGRLARSGPRQARRARRRGGPGRAAAGSPAARPSRAAPRRPRRLVVTAEPGQQVGAGGQAGQRDHRDAAGRRDAAVGRAQRGVEVAGAGQRAAGMDPDDVGEVRPQDAVERRSRPRWATASHSANRPSRIATISRAVSISADGRRRAR